MRAAILAVGSELLTSRPETNSLTLAAALGRFGIRVASKSIVGDRLEELAAEIGRLQRDHELVLVTGGLGPTADDLTRQAVAGALGRTLALDESLAEQIETAFRRLGRAMPTVNREQAKVIEGARVLINRRGTAPGQRLDAGRCSLFLFPGVPRELEGMIDEHLVPWLASRTDGVALEKRVLRVACLPESEVEEQIAPLYERFGEEGIAVLASPGDVRIEWTAASGDERLDAVGHHLTELLGDAVYGEGAEALEVVTGRLLRDAGITLATAESCTGGLVAERLTRVAGSSTYFVGSIVAYANDVKARQLDVSSATLERYGAVSREAAREMAEGVRRRLASDLAVAITGVAGPSGGTDDKPVGTVWLAWNGPEGTFDTLRRFPGDRRMVRWLASQWALDGVRRMVSGRPLLPGVEA